MKDPSMVRCQGILALLWVVGAVVLGFIMQSQVSNGVYTLAQRDDAWAWYRSALIAYVSMIITTLFVAQSQQRAKRAVDPEVSVSVPWLNFVLALFVSVAYLIFLLITLHGAGTTNPSDSAGNANKAIDALRGANAFLSILQGIVGVVLGYFFMSSETKTPPGAGGAGARAGEGKPPPVNPKGA